MELSDRHCAYAGGPRYRLMATWKYTCIDIAVRRRGLARLRAGIAPRRDPSTYGERGERAQTRVSPFYTPTVADGLPQHFFHFLPLPHGHGALRPTLCSE